MGAKKSYGQHFLINQGVIEKIVDAVTVQDDDVLVEIGPGLGALSTKLAERFGVERLLLIEADARMADQVQEKLPSVDIQLGDAAQVDFDILLGGRSWVLIGNLPYNAASAIIMNALSTNNPPKELVVMVQKEQADRMLAQAGETGILSLAIQLQCNPERLFHVAPGSFVPAPKVQSSVLRLVPIAHDRAEVKKILDLARIGFQHRRKQLAANLSTGLNITAQNAKESLKSCGLDAQIRAQDLSLEDWKRLTISMDVARNVPTAQK